MEIHLPLNIFIILLKKTIQSKPHSIFSPHHLFLPSRLFFRIVNFSLRFCDITDAEVDQIAHALGNLVTQNWKLLTLSLTGNRIGDNGARALAKVKVNKFSFGNVERERNLF